MELEFLPFASLGNWLVCPLYDFVSYATGNIDFWLVFVRRGLPSVRICDAFALSYSRQDRHFLGEIKVARSHHCMCLNLLLV